MLSCCSVGGLDYGTVRAGAFMGLQMLSSLEDTLSRQSSYTGASRLDRSALGNGCAQQNAIGVPSQNCCTLPTQFRAVLASSHTDPLPDPGATGGSPLPPFSLDRI